MRQSKALKIAIHTAGWLLFLSLLISFVSVFNRGQLRPWHQTIQAGVFVFFGLWVAVFYLNAYLLIPKLYLRQQYVAYFGIFVLLLVAVYLVQPFDVLLGPRADRMPPMPEPGMRFPGADSLRFRSFPGRPNRPPGFRNRTDIISISLLVAAWSASFGWQMIKAWRRTERRAIQAEADKAYAELSFLRAQINPHFLFNTLNNIYALAVTQHEQTAPSIMKLSQIMRYITETAQKDQVPLESAVACITNYIDLHRLRLNQQTTIDYGVSGNLQSLQMSPLLLLPFVENVFKYGISSHEPSPITIRLQVTDQTILFDCRNRIFRQHKATESTGIGISNTRKRLAFMYPGRHRLEIGEADGWFTVHLEVQLSATDSTTQKNAVL